MAKNVKHIYRSANNKMIAGVCGGLAEYFNTDPTLVRLIWVVLSVMTGVFAGIVAYLLAWAIIPRNPKHKWR